MRLLILLLVAVAVAASRNSKFNWDLTVEDLSALDVAMLQIDAITKAVREGDKNYFIMLVSKAKENPNIIDEMMKKWSSVEIIVGEAEYEGDRRILMTGAILFEEGDDIDSFVFEKKRENWVLTDFPTILGATPTRGKLHDK